MVAFCFLENFYPSINQQMDFSVVDFSESPVPPRAVLAGTNAASDGRGIIGIPKEWEGTGLLGPFKLNSTGDC